MCLTGPSQIVFVYPWLKVKRPCGAPHYGSPWWLQWLLRSLLMALVKWVFERVSESVCAQTLYRCVCMTVHASLTEACVSSSVFCWGKVSQCLSSIHLGLSLLLRENMSKDLPPRSSLSLSLPSNLSISVFYSFFLCLILSLSNFLLLLSLSCRIIIEGSG